MPSSPMRHLALRSVAAVLLAAAGIAVVPPPAANTAPRVTVRFQPVSLSGRVPAGLRATVTAGGDVRASREGWTRDASLCADRSFTMVGLVWRQEGLSEVEADMAWGDAAPATSRPAAPGRHIHVHADPGDGPDQGSPDDAGILGTEPVWTGGARCIGFRLRLPAGEAIGDVRAVFVDTGEEASGGTGFAAALSTAWRAVAGVWGPAPAGAIARRPGIVRRAEWGADESLRNCGPFYAPSLKMAFVHHTASGNNYTRAQADDVVRGIYAYHVKARGYCDIAYNFLVDRYGRVYEGRYGGMAEPVIGGHAMGFNTGSTGVSAIGNFSTASPPAAMVRPLQRLLAWRLDVAHLPPKGTATMVSAGGSTTRFPAGRKVTLPVIAGHRDTGLTSCPGRLYDLLPQIRRAAHRIGLPKLFRPKVSTPGIQPGESTVRFTAALTGNLRWFVDIHDPQGERVRRLRGTGTSISAVWDGRASGGQPVPVGFYEVRLWARRLSDGAKARAAVLTIPACSILGTRGADVLQGGPGADFICGLQGNDVIAGGGGADVIVGGRGFDTIDLSGAGGPVDVDLAAGTATGQGADRLYDVEGVIGSSWGDVLRGNSAGNRLDGRGGDDVLIGRGGDDRLVGGDGVDTADYSGAPGRVVVDLGAGTASGEGRDVLSGIEVVIGSPYADRIYGSAGDDRLVGGGGGDDLRGRGGNDVLDGGPGPDQLRGGPGDDLLLGGGGADVLRGNAGADDLQGGAGNDTIHALDGEADTLDGGDGTDSAEWDEGLDVVVAVERRL